MLTVDPLETRPGLSIHDRIEDVRFEWYTDRTVTPLDVDPESFRVPVSEAGSLETRELTAPKPLVWYVRTRRGESGDEVVPPVDRTFPAGEYELEVAGLPFKCYCHLTGPFTIRAGDGETTLAFEEETTVTFGVRSFHEQPAATVTTTADPQDLLRAVSTFGSALKTTSPERSWPTLRGHPPLIERGAELSIPDGLEPPASDVHLEVPPTLGHIYRVTPLAYYLGAPVKPGPDPVLVADGTELGLRADGDLDEGLRRTLERAFFLDCIVRTEGLYDLDLSERTALDDDLPFDPATVYAQSLAERLRTYAEVPYTFIEPVLPEWPLCSDVQATPETISYLPFAANRLSHVRIADEVQTAEGAAETESPELGTFFRGEQRGIARDGTAADTPTWHDLDFFRPPDARTTTHAWVGEGYPLGTAKTDTTAIRRRLDRTVDDSGPISVHLVCNDDAMAEETAGELYGLRDLLEFEVSVGHDLTTAEFRELCHTEIDFLHYIGHVDEGGVVCADGSLDLRTLESTDVRAFLLNACHSYQQGEALVDAGADGGIVTLSRVFNDQATKMGRLAARLLNHGFPLDATMDVLSHGPLSSHRYAAVGDHRTAVCQPTDSLPGSATIKSIDNSEVTVQVQNYFTDREPLGKITRPMISSQTQWHLAGSLGNEFTASKSEVSRYLRQGSMPLLVEGEITWDVDRALESG
jgi:hypothetical protein